MWYYPGIFLEGPHKPTENFSHDSRFLGQHLNSGPPNYEALNQNVQYIQGVPRGKVNSLGDHSIGHSKKKVYMNGFRYLGRSILNLARNIFLPSDRNAPLSEACESV
jgi:hypothetical protein